jgi:hypothetical protein
VAYTYTLLPAEVFDPNQVRGFAPFWHRADNLQRDGSGDQRWRRTFMDSCRSLTKRGPAANEKLNQQGRYPILGIIDLGQPGLAIFAT